MSSHQSALERALAGDAELRRHLQHAASRHTRTEQDAEDLCQTAFVDAIRRARRTGEPKPPVTFFQFVGSILNSLGATRRRSLRRRPEPVAYEEERSGVVAAAPDPERALTDHGEMRDRDRLERELRAYMATEAGEEGRVPLGLLEWADRGVTKNAEFAEKVGCSVEEVLRAKKRIGRHGARIRRQILAEQGAVA
jgi:DNA-directed RNA polymerase specialized sigma24 family protein